MQPQHPPRTITQLALCKAEDAIYCLEVKKKIESIHPFVPQIQVALPMELTVSPAKTEMSLFRSQPIVSHSDLKRTC